jgi:protein SCO1/2
MGNPEAGANRLPLLLAIVFGLALLWVFLGWQPRPDRAAVDTLPGLAPPPQGGDFVLDAHSGAVALADYRGRLVVLYFGYTWCPDICPTGLAVLALALDQLSARERDQVQVIFVSVDPQRDTPQRLETYAGYFHDSILGVTGTPRAVAEVAGRYGVAYRVVQQQSATEYTVDHSAGLHLVDRDGKLRLTLPHGTSPARIAAILREQIDQP